MKHLKIKFTKSHNKCTRPNLYDRLHSNPSVIHNGSIGPHRQVFGFILPIQDGLTYLREFVLVENIRQVCLLELTADFGVKTNAKLMPDYQLRERAKLVFRAENRRRT